MSCNSSCLIWSKPLKRVMKKHHDGMILKEKDTFSSKLNTSNDVPVNKGHKKSGSTLKINGVSSEQSTSTFNPPKKKTPKKCHALQSNTLAVWLEKKWEKKKLNVVEKSEKENQKYKHTPKKLENIKTPASAAIQDVSSKSSTKHNESKVKSHHKFEETSSGIIKSSKKLSEREAKHAKEESHLHQRRLGTYLNQDDKQTKHGSEKKWKRITGHLSSETDKKDKDRPRERHKEDVINNSKSARKSKAEVKKYLFSSSSTSSSTSSLEEKFKELDKRIENLVDNKKSDKHTNHSHKSRSSSTAVQNNNAWLSKEGENKVKHKSRDKTKYNKLPVKVDSNRSRENLDEKSKSRKRSRSKSDVENSFVKQENLKSSLNRSSSIKKDTHHNKTGETEHRPKSGNKEYLDKNKKSSRNSSKSKTKQSDLNKSQKKLDSYFIDDNKRKFITRSESNESCEFPSFKNSSNKAKKPKKDEFLKKYGMAIPSVEEILKEQKDLEKYKQQIQSFQAMENKSFELPFSVKDLNRTEESCKDILGCKHLSIDQITEAFKKNLKYVSDIFHGKIFNERHDRFYSNTNYALTTKDLCYSTSMIVFNFDQKEHLITLLKSEFDPDDKWTAYFFQVLLPELCMKIFMDIHGMSYDEAVKYLDARPIVDD